MRRFLVATAVAIVTSVVFAPAPAGAVAGPYTVHQFNMWAKNHLTYGGQNPADFAKAKIGTTQPMILTYNEVCRSQYNSLKTYLGTAYQSTFRVVVAGPPSCNGEDFGLAIFIRGSSISETLDGYYGAANQYPGDETRRYYCIRTVFVAVPLVGCVTHLTNDSESFASRQSGELAYLMGANWGSIHHFAGGDFNMRPSFMRTQTDGAQYWHQQYHEADYTYERWTHSCRTTDLKKFDYIFGGNNNSSVASTATVHACAANTSDHKYIVGSYYLN